jgi:hypothetical protein
VEGAALQLQPCAGEGLVGGAGAEALERSEHQGMAEPPAAKQIYRRDVLGGLIHEYERAA